MSSAPAIANDGRGQELAHDQRHEGALARRERLQIVAAQVLGDEVVEPVFGLVWRELLDERKAPGVRDIRRHLPTQRAMAHGARRVFSVAKTCSSVRSLNCSRKLLRSPKT